MMKKYVYLSGLLFLSLLVSCHHDTTVKVGFLLPNLTDARYPKDCKYFTEKIKQLGGSVETGDAHNDPFQQEAQAREMIRKGIKALVIAAVNQNIAASIVRYAHDDGVKVIAYERLIQHCDLDYFVAFDHYMVGKLQASYAIQKKPYGNYIIIGGDKGDRNAELIKKGQLEVIEPLVKSGKINILYNIFVEDWSPENAYHEVRKVLNLSGENIDVVLSANDGMAGGIISALDEHPQDSPVLVTGLDADLPACQRIAWGKQTMTVYKPFKEQAEIAAELAMKLAKGQYVEKTDTTTTFNGMVNVATIPLKPIAVDIANLRNTVITDGYLKESDIAKQ